METRIKKWGNSLALRIPKALAEEAGLSYDVPVELSLVEGKLIIALIEPSRPDLETLLAQVTEENLHAKVDVGPPTGQQAW
jgi:antitoxin MazE